MNVSIGIDIGGTKCALSVGACATDSVRILHREEFPTKGKSWREVLEEFGKRMDLYLSAPRREGAPGTVPDVAGRMRICTLRWAGSLSQFQTPAGMRKPQRSFTAARNASSSGRAPGFSAERRMADKMVCNLFIIIIVFVLQNRQYIIKKISRFSNLIIFLSLIQNKTLPFCNLLFFLLCILSKFYGISIFCGIIGILSLL